MRTRWTYASSSSVFYYFKMHSLFQRLSVHGYGINNNIQRRYRWSGPNYSKGVFLISLSAVLGALGASMFRKFWQIEYEIEPNTRTSDEKK